MICTNFFPLQFDSIIQYDAYLGAMKGKIEWLKQGYFVLLPELDELGRTIMYV